MGGRAALCLYGTFGLVWCLLACSEGGQGSDNAGTAGANAQAGRGGATAGNAGNDTNGSGGTLAASSGAAGTSASAGRAGDGGRSGSSASMSGSGGTAGSLGGAGSSGAGLGGAGAADAGSAGTPGGSGNAGASAGGSAASAGAGGLGDSDRCDIARVGEDPPRSLTLTGNLGTHDPVVIAAHDQFYLFATGDNIGAKTSTDLVSWDGVPEVWNAETRPTWISDEVPAAVNLWAPDISYFGGQYHLYYSASTFGCNVSCIGHATRPALNSGSWDDHGSIICSNPGSSCQGSRPDDWNAIDPNVIVDRDGTPWLSFGSFWGGLKMFELDQNGERAGDRLISLAARPNDGGALEAPFIVRRCGYYYLFASWDTCCQGADSTYNIRVGRAAEVTGPYVDEQGSELLQGGGTLLLEGGTRWRGPGHSAVIFTETAAYNVFHSYDASNDGNPTLRIAELVWDEDGWPISGGP